MAQIAAAARSAAGGSLPLLFLRYKVLQRAGEDVSFLSAFHDPDGADCLLAERAFVRALDGGCTSPVAAHAVLEGDTLRLTGLNVTAENTPFFDQISGPRAQAEALGRTLAERMKR